MIIHFSGYSYFGTTQLICFHTFLAYHKMSTPWDLLVSSKQTASPSVITVGGHFADKVIEEVKLGKKLHRTGDNCDMRILRSMTCEQTIKTKISITLHLT